MSELKVYEELEDYVGYEDDTPTAMYDKSEVDKKIAELKAENRRLKRAQWLARAERAKETQFKWAEYCHCDTLYFCKPLGVSTRKNPYRHISRMNIVEWDAFWEKIKNKCLSKAEEYK